MEDMKSLLRGCTYPNLWRNDQQEIARCATSVEILSDFHTAVWKGLHEWQNDFEGHSLSSGLAQFDAPYITSFLLVVYSNSVFVNHVWDITTFTVYVTACDLEKT